MLRDLAFWASSDNSPTIVYIASTLSDLQIVEATRLWHTLVQFDLCLFFMPWSLLGLEILIYLWSSVFAHTNHLGTKLYVTFRLMI
jgi:hypothetical protein